MFSFWPSIVSANVNHFNESRLTHPGTDYYTFHTRNCLIVSSLLMTKKLLVLILIVSVCACTRDMTEPRMNTCGSDLDYVSYAADVINASCALSGCHDGVSGTAPGDFTNYAGIEPFLINGSFSSRVFDLKDNPVLGMPPDDAVNFGGVADLDAETLEQLMTWVDAGFPNEGSSIVATYDETVKTVIDATCAYAGCHNGTPGVPGDYSTYNGLTLDLENGSFFRRVIESADDPVLGMPPDRATGPKDLTEEEFQLILCWVENDYPEN